VQSVELGWHVDPGVESDTNTHLFVYSTQNGYNLGDGFPGNCYNLTCSQFVQVSSPAFYPGETVTGIVGPGSGAPIEGAFQVFNPGPTAPASEQNWYVYIDGDLIGYYPGGTAGIFKGTMQTSATTMETGGEIFSDYVNEPEPDAYMGTGLCPTCSGYGGVGSGFGVAAYIRDVYYLKTGTGSGSICGSPFCSNGYCYTSPSPSWAVGTCGYQASSFYSTSTTVATGGSSSTCWGPYFYFGGGAI
jgi:hypothetical protein